MDNLVPFQRKGLVLGRRIHVMGNSCAGKSTLAEQLATVLDCAFVDLDALNWQRNWVALVDSDPAELERRITRATAGDSWVVAGSYIRFSQPLCWPKLDTVLWLDLPRRVVVWRMLLRSWRRWRSQELLWGTNTERFWPQLAFWRKEDSLLWWIVTQHHRKREQMLSYSNDERWAHIQFVQLKSAAEVKAFLVNAELSSAAV